MKITSIETWLVHRTESLFDAAREGGAPMDWDVLVLQLRSDTGAVGTASCLAARGGAVPEALIHETVAPILLGREATDREAIWHDLWNVNRHLVFFPLYLPGPIDVALWDMAAVDAGLPLYRYLGARRTRLPVYASGLFHSSTDEYVAEALRYQSRGIRAYKAHPPGPWQVDMEVHQAIRDAVGDDMVLMSDPVGEYTLDEAIRVGRHLERLDYRWLEEPFRDVEAYKYAELCRALDIPIAATETTPNAHWGVAQSISQRAADIVRADVSWKAGITGTMKIAHLAEAFGMNCEIHTTTMGLMDMANVHVSCAIGNCEWFEYFVPEQAFQLPAMNPLPVTDDGFISPPEAPGIGFEVDWDAVENGCVSHRVTSG